MMRTALCVLWAFCLLVFAGAVFSLGLWLAEVEPWYGSVSGGLVMVLAFGLLLALADDKDWWL